MKFRLLRKYLRGWSKNKDAEYRRLKEEMLQKLDSMDKLSENIGLTNDMRKEQKELRLQLDFLLKQQESKWKQISKDRKIREGDLNTRYYHAKANGRKRKNEIISLEQEEGVIDASKMHT